jgi:phosphatidylserine/phosphatidylglycerophosphate/cardiolipin synthase-like enzyme
MTSLLLATGFTGGLTLVFVVRWVARYLGLHLAVTTHFSPKGGCTDAVVREIKSARREILMQAYSFTSKPIAQALIDAKARGVHVDILLDKSNEQEAYTELGHLLHEGLAPHIDAQHAIAHNKIMILDRRTLITGSFNFTHQAETDNAENLIIIKGHPELVQAYFQQFAAHKSHCQAPNPKPQAAPAAHRTAA